MGLRLGSDPDDDPTIQLLQRLSTLVAKVVGVNTAAEDVRRTEKEISYLEKEPYDISIHYYDWWELPVKVKTYKFALHLEQKLRERENVQSGEINQPEEDHKGEKTTYHVPTK